MSLIHRLFGRSDNSVTIPVMDGPFLPNQKLENAEFVFAAPDVDNLVVFRDRLYASSGVELMRSRSADRREFEVVERFPRPISALAARGESLAIGLDGHGVTIRGGRFDGVTVDRSRGGPNCPTALAWLDDASVVACNGSAIREAGEWRRSLLERDASGSLIKIDLARGAATGLRAGLAWPAGVAVAAERLLVAESWRHRVLSLDQSGGRFEVPLDHLPAYPARIAPAARGGYWLAFYSVRNQLVEFILREPVYRTRMMAEIPEAYWMAPALASGNSFKEPMQGSQLKQMGILKPYAASRSYGLVAYCDAAMKPIGAFHSRADGRRHGAVAACELDDALYVASRGSAAVVRIAAPLTSISE